MGEADKHGRSVVFFTQEDTKFFLFIIIILSSYYILLRKQNNNQCCYAIKISYRNQVTKYYGIRFALRSTSAVQYAQCSGTRVDEGGYTVPSLLFVRFAWGIREGAGCHAPRATPYIVFCILYYL